MRSASLFAVAASLAILAAARPAYACSFSWAPGSSPADIRARSDVRMVRGTFRVGEARGEVGDDGVLVSGWIYGRIETRRGTHWNTVQPYHQFLVECAAYPRPTADANGIFWIKRRGTDGRYELLLWEGEYLARPESRRQEGSR